MHKSSTELAEYIRATSEPFRVTANGTWLSAGRPVVPSLPLSVREISGVSEYVPGDLTITVRAGTTHTELDAITAAEGQWLGLDPAGADTGTIGATIATASVGPLVHGIGAVRDIVLGMEVVSGDGVITRSGGKVVKNVAGFDLVRLQTGAWGTLGIITEVSLRLRAVPEVDETVALQLDASVPLATHLAHLRSLTLSPLAMELLGAALATALGISTQQVFLVRLGGNETRVRAQRAQLASLGALVDCTASVWHSLRGLEHDGKVHGVGGARHAVARVSHQPSQLTLTWSHVHKELSSVSLSGALVRATVSRGIARVVIPQLPTQSPEHFAVALASITRTLAPPGGHVVWEQLPASAWSGVPSAVADRISTGLQRTFDPAARCNSGILGATLQA
ncbi:MAG: FAD-binding protein [Gemmatimonas sp.]